MTAIDLSIIIPCYNEGQNVAEMERTLLPIVAQLAEHQTVEVIAVDDGSGDDTLERLRQLAARYASVRVAYHARNMGIGAALRTGFSIARGAWVLTTDADGTYRFGEIPALVARCAGDVDVVTASPYHPQGGVQNVPAYRLVLSRGASSLYRLIVGGHIHTYTALFRVYRRDVLDNVQVRYDGFLSVAQLLAEASLAGYRIAEYPTVLHVRRYGQSKAKVVRLTFAHLRFMLGLVRHRLGSRAQDVRYGKEAL